jgi:hypothetical protein
MLSAAWPRSTTVTAWVTWSAAPFAAPPPHPGGRRPSQRPSRPRPLGQRRCLLRAHASSLGQVAAAAVSIGTEVCRMRRCLSILVTCWSCGRIANAATGTSTRRPPTCSSARTNAPGAATARRTSCAAYARTAAASSSGAPSARPVCSRSTRHRPKGLSGQDAPRHLPADRRQASRRAGEPDGSHLITWRSIHRQRVRPGTRTARQFPPNHLRSGSPICSSRPCPPPPRTRRTRAVSHRAPPKRIRIWRRP